MRTADPHAPTKEKIVQAAIKLMLAQGFTATSVDEIITEADATKGSFFHFFKSKEDLAKTALERFVHRVRERFQSAPFEKETDPKRRVLGRIDAAIEVFQDPRMPKSCLLGNFSQELAPTHPEFQSLCSKWFSLASEGFARDLANAGCPDAQRLADLFQTVVQGSMLLGKAKKDPSIAVENLKHLKRYFESLMEGWKPQAARR